MVPLTSSLYVAGEVRRRPAAARAAASRLILLWQLHTEQRVTVDVGTGYFLEKARGTALRCRLPPADAAVAQQTIPGAKEFLERRTGFLKGKIEELQPVVMVRLPPPPAGSALRRRDGGPQAKMREKQMVDEVLQVHRRSMRRPCPPPPTR